MGNTTGITSRQRADEVAARIGGRLDAQRVELFEITVDGARLTRRWTALSHPAAEFDAGDGADEHEVPLGWFPWSLGNIRPSKYMFIRNAGALAVAHDSSTTIGDLGLTSALHLPVLGLAPGICAAATLSSAPVIGAVCAYWSDERASWSSDDRELLCSWALDASSALR
ncbi:MAG: hypothetical protein U0Q22_00510 [Acidimicrobiales bacterium]